MASESSPLTITSLSSSSVSPTTTTAVVAAATTHKEEDAAASSSSSSSESSEESYYTSLCSKFGIRFILMNSCYGGFGFSKSEEFVGEICRRFKHDPKILKLFIKVDYDEEDLDDYPDDYEDRYLDVYDIGVNGIRRNPIMLEMLDDMGSEFCSSRYAELQKSVIPMGYDRWLKYEYDSTESISVDFDKAYVDKIHDVLDQQYTDDMTIVEDLRTLRQNMDNFKQKWYGDAVKKIGDAMLPLIKARLYETGRGVGDEVWKELALLDIPDMVGLLQTPKQFDSVLIQKSSKEFDALALQIKDMVVASESIPRMFDVLRHDAKSKMTTTTSATDNDSSTKVKQLLDEMIELGEIAIEVSARTYNSCDLMWPILQKRIHPIVECCNVTSTTTSKLLSAVRRGCNNPIELYKISHQIDQLELLLLKKLDGVVSQELSEVEKCQKPLLSRRFKAIPHYVVYRSSKKERKRNKSFFSRFAEDG